MSQYTPEEIADLYMTKAVERYVSRDESVSHLTAIRSAHKLLNAAGFGQEHRNRFYTHFKNAIHQTAQQAEGVKVGETPIAQSSHAPGYVRAAFVTALTADSQKDMGFRWFNTWKDKPDHAGAQNAPTQQVA